MKQPYKKRLEQLFELLQQDIPQGQEVKGSANGQQIVRCRP